uniref:Uncharacterized protein n=1 Tax=Meloidogyne enterolobii TaxID=390850 RepID=A0A6V7VJ90_MELEN|nr:unnamed protein product [Meloidogyne enterolobii]
MLASWIFSLSFSSLHIPAIYISVSSTQEGKCQSIHTTKLVLQLFSLIFLFHHKALLFF